MVHYTLIKSDGEKAEIDKLLKTAEERFDARIYTVPNDLKDEVEEETVSFAYHGVNLVLAEFPSEKEQEEFVGFSGGFLLEHRSISNLGFPKISNLDLIKKIKKGGKKS